MEQGGYNSSTDWMKRASCRDLTPELFFPVDGEGVDEARTVCAGCVVKSLCLEYALVNHIEHGVWGGTSERERKRIAKGRRR